MENNTNFMTLENTIIIRETDEAYLCDYDGVEAWIPKSTIGNLEEVNDRYTNMGGGAVMIDEIIIPENLALDKELI
jgi:hypothetical protein